MEFLLIFTIVASLLFCYYYLFLRKEKRYQFNRFFLLLLLPVSAYAPFLDFSIHQPAELSPIIGSTLETITITSSEVNAWVWSYNELLSFLYISIVLCLLFLLISRLFSILRIILESPTKEKIEGATLIHCNGKTQASSFGPYIFWNPTIELSTDEKAQIISHELCHVKQYHSLDILFIELWKVIFWFHPIVYLIGRELKMIHEYQADEAAMDPSNSNSYIQLLLSQLMGQPLQLSHSFFHSTPKNRIMMILRKTDSRLTHIKYLLLLPFMSMIFIACTININSIPEGYSIIKTSSLTQAGQNMGHGPTENLEASAGQSPAYKEEVPAPQSALDQVQTPIKKLLNIESTSDVEEFFRDREEEKQLEDAFEDVPNIRRYKDEPDISEFLEVNQEPKPININEIKKLVGYPKLARDQGLQGQAIFRILVNKHGRYKKHRVINKVHPIFILAIEKHINKLKFEPAYKEGKPVQFWVNIPFNFKLIGTKSKRK